MTVQGTGEEEQSFRKRINELLTSLSPKFSKFLFGEMTSKTRNKLVSTIIDTRNYYTHRDEKTKYPNVVKNHKELDDITKQLFSILQFYCLTFIGVDSQIVEQRLMERKLLIAMQQGACHMARSLLHVGV